MTSFRPKLLVCHAYCRKFVAPKGNCGAVAKIGLQAAPVLVLRYFEIALTGENRFKVHYIILAGHASGIVVAESRIQLQR